MSDDMDRVIESGKSFFSGPGVKHGSMPKTKDGDESVAMGMKFAHNGGSWMTLLDDGSDNPYPSTVQALKSKNTRDSNDSFR